MKAEPKFSPKRESAKDADDFKAEAQHTDKLDHAGAGAEHSGAS